VFVHANRRMDGQTNDETTKPIAALSNFSITPNSNTDSNPTCFGTNYHLQEIHVPTANYTTGCENL
jgi:hypothetical protein